LRSHSIVSGSLSINRSTMWSSSASLSRSIVSVPNAKTAGPWCREQSAQGQPAVYGVASKVCSVSEAIGTGGCDSFDSGGVQESYRRNQDKRKKFQGAGGSYVQELHRSGVDAIHLWGCGLSGLLRGAALGGSRGRSGCHRAD
jgi:hypothetical protein